MLTIVSWYLFALGITIKQVFIELTHQSESCPAEDKIKLTTTELSVTAYRSLLLVASSLPTCSFILIWFLILGHMVFIHLLKYSLRNRWDLSYNFGYLKNLLETITQLHIILLIKWTVVWVLMRQRLVQCITTATMLFIISWISCISCRSHLL